MFESDCSDDEINLSYKSVTGFTKKEDVPLKLWAEHFSKPEKDRNKSLTKIFEKEFNFLKSLYCFLENDQVMGKTLTKFGIPNICGKIDKKFVKLSSKRSYKVNKYERRNKTYLSKPHLLSKKIYIKPSSSKKQDFVIHRYTPVVERWSDTALNKFKSVQKIQSPQTYIFDDDGTLEKPKHNNAAPSTTPTVVGILAKLANRTASDTNVQKSVEGIENHNPRAAVVNEMKGLLKQNCNKYYLKKSVRFNDDDLCSFAPTQDLLESLSRELSNSETTFDEITRDKSVLTLPDSAKTYKTVSDKTEQKSSEETVTNDLVNTSAILSLGISNLQESFGESQINPKRSFEKEKMIETDFEVEPYDNENIVIEDFTESYSDSKNQVEQEKGRLLNLEPGINETTKGYILNTIDTVKINKERNQQFFVSNNLNVSESPKARILEHEKGRLLNLEPGINETTKGYILNTIDTVKINKERNQQFFVSNNLGVSESQKARIQEQKTAEETNKDQLNIENNKNIENYFINSKTKINISEKSLSSSQGKNISGGKSIDSHFKTHSDTGSTQIIVNSKTKEDLFELRGILVQTSSQQQSINNELNVSESKDIVVPETPSSDGTTDSKSCKSSLIRYDGCQLVVPNSSEESQISKASVRSLNSNAVVLETPPSNETSAGSRSLTIDKMSLNVLESKVENYTQKESHPLNSSAQLSYSAEKSAQNSSAHLLVEDWSDDEFIPLSPSQPQNHNESSVNITTINGSIISSDGVENNTKPRMVNEDNSLKSVFTLEGKQFENTSNSIGMLSPCSSMSGRDYISNSSQCEREELLPTKEKYESSNLNTGSQIANNLKTTQEAEIYAKNRVSVNENEIILNDLHNKISFSRQTITDSSNLCTPNSDLQTENVGYKRPMQTSFAANAPSKVKKNAQTDSSTIDKSQENASQEEENSKGLNVMKHESLNALNPIHTLSSENKVRKILFPLQTQSSEIEMKNEAKINYSKLLLMTTNSLNILNWKENKEIKETENQDNQKSMEEKYKKYTCFSDMNLSNKGLNNSEMINGAFYGLNSAKESFGYPPIASKPGTGSSSNDLTVTENLIVCENEINGRVKYESSNFISCSQTKNEKSLSACSSIQDECNTNLPSQNECALILLTLSKEKEKSSASDNNANIFKNKYESQEVLSNPEASSVDTSRKNTHPDFNNENLTRSEMDISMNNKEVSTNKMLSFPNESVILKSDNVSVESEKIQNNYCINHSYDSIQLNKSEEYPTKISENKISRNTQLKNDKANKISEKQESALCSNSLSTDISMPLDINLSEDCEKTLAHKKETSFTTTKTPIKVHTDHEKSLEMEHESMEQMTQNHCNNESPVMSTSEHSKAINISNQTIPSVTVTAINTIKILPSSAIKPHIPTKEIVNPGKNSGINLKEGSTTMESIKIPFKIKSEMSNTTKSNKIKNKKALKEISEITFESIVQSEHKDCKAESPILIAASPNTAHVLSCAESKTNITDTTNAANNNNIKRVTSSAIESQLKTTESVVSSFKSSGIDPNNSMGSENLKVPPKITNETQVTHKFIRVSNKKEQNENGHMIISENDDSNNEALISTSNVHLKSSNIPIHKKENIDEIDSVSGKNVGKIFTKRQNVASHISSGINNQYEGDDTGKKNKNMLQIKKTVTSSSINANTHRKKGFAELSDFMVEKSPQQHSISESKDNEKQNANEMCFTPGNEASKTSEFHLVPTSSYDILQIRNDETRALSSSENRLKTTNQSQLYIKRVGKNKNVNTSKSSLNNNSPENDVPKRNANVYSSNVILLSNEASLHNQSKLSVSHQNQISGGKRDDVIVEKCYKNTQFTTNSIPVMPSRIGQNYESIAYNIANCQEHKSVPVPYRTKQLKKYKSLISENTIKPQTQTPKLDIMIKKLNESKNENRDSLRINSSSKNKSRAILKTTNLLPIKNWHNIEQQTESVNPKSIEQEIKKKSSGILLSTENLCVIRSSSHNQHQQWMTDKSELPESSNQISKKYNNQNSIGYKSLSTIKLQNSKQESSKEEDKRQLQMQQQDYKLSTKGHPQLRLTQNKQWRSEKHGESKEELINASSSKHFNKNVISYTSSSTIKSLRFGQGNLNETENEHNSLIENSPPDSDNESFYLEESLGDVDKQSSMNYKGGFESLLTSDDESVQDFSGSIGCTNGNFSPISSIGSDMLSNEIFNNSSNKQLKRRFLDNLDNYVSDDSNSEAGPSKFSRKNMLCASRKVNDIIMDGKIVSSDNCVPSYHSDMSEQLNDDNLSSNEESQLLDISPQYDHDMRDVNNLDSIKGSDHTITMMTDSPIPSYSEGLNNDYLMSSPSRPDDYEENNSPIYDSNCQSSDEDRNNYYLTDMFDD